MRAYVAELVYQRAAAYNCIIVNHYFSCQLGSVGDNHIVTYDTVVGHMRICHDKAVAAYLGFAACGSTAVHGHTLSYGGVVAYYGQSVLATEFKVLWDCADNGTRKYYAVFTYT